MKDADGSLSAYDYTTGKYAGIGLDPTWKTFTGGSLAGLTPSKHSASNPTGTIDGIETGLIYHLNPTGNGGAGVLEYYDYNTGIFIGNVFPCLTPVGGGTLPAQGTLTGGALAGVTLKDALANGIGGTVVGKPTITYLGINQQGSFYMNFYDATANRILIYDAFACGAPNNTFSALEPTTLTPNVLTPNSGPRVLADVLGPKFLGVGFNELSFILLLYNLGEQSYTIIYCGGSFFST